jgi:uncharacterized MAPEG superfamily protein
MVVTGLPKQQRRRTINTSQLSSKEYTVTALQWLALTALMTGIMALPYVVGRIGAIGLGGAMANPSEELAAKEPLWVRRGKAAHYNAVENLVVFATLVLVAQHMNRQGSNQSNTFME